MTTQLNFSAAANPVSSLVGAGLSDARATPAGGDSGAGGRFAEVFTGQMLKLERQGLAAAQGGLGSLQMMPLGQTINVITSDAPVPDIQSLLAFAKAQGLDDMAVAGLFGEMPAVPQGAKASSFLSQGVSGDGQLAVATPPTGVLDVNVSPAQPLTLGLLQAVPGVSITGLQVAPKPVVDDVAAPAPADNNMRGQDAVAIALALAPAAVQAARPVVAAMQAAEIPAPAAAEASPPMLDALRVQMGIPSEAITRRLAQLSGSKTSLSWAELVAKAAAKADAGSLAGASAPTSTVSSAGAGPDAALALASVSGALNADGASPAHAAALAASASAARLVAGQPGAAEALQDQRVAGTPTSPLADDASALAVPEEVVTLDVPAGLDLGALSHHQGAPMAESGGAPQGGASTPAAQSQQTAADAARAALHERAAQTQQLADRRGQALANKLISQIERGQWKLQLRMQPGSLGRVEVALDMHAGGLDAVFRTDNAVTQDLLGQGAQRLRDALTQSGTTVASVTVHADARGQSGGNSTPQQRQPAPKQSASPAAVGAVSARAARYTGGVAEGLNVLA